MFFRISGTGTNLFWYCDDRDRRLIFSRFGFPCVTASPLLLFFLCFLNPNCRPPIPEASGIIRVAESTSFSFIPLTSSASRRGNFSHSSTFSTSNFHSVHSHIRVAESTSFSFIPLTSSASRRGNFSHSSTFSTSNFQSVHSHLFGESIPPHSVTPILDSSLTLRLLGDSTCSSALHFVRLFHLLRPSRLVSSLHLLTFPVSSTTRFPPPLHTPRLHRPRLLENTFSSSAARMLFFPGISAEN